MSEEQLSAVQLAMLESAHRQAVKDLMLSDDIGDVARVARILELEAKYLGLMEKLRAAREAEPASGPDDRGA